MNNLSAPSEPTGSIRRIPLETTDDKMLHARLEAQDASSEDSTFDTWIDWNEVEVDVSRLQRQLAIAVEHSNRKAIRHYK